MGGGKACEKKEMTLEFQDDFRQPQNSNCITLTISRVKNLVKFAKH